MKHLMTIRDLTLSINIRRVWPEMRTVLNACAVADVWAHLPPADQLVARQRTSSYLFGGQNRSLLNMIYKRNLEVTS